MTKFRWNAWLPTLALNIFALFACAQAGAQAIENEMPVLGGGLATATRGSGRLPALGEVQVWTTGQEQSLAETLLASLYRDQAVLEDDVLQDYLSAIWTPLFASAQRQGILSPDMVERFDWRLLTIRDASVNAFAMPGGVVGVHLGLMAVTDTPAQLAAVLAHELSHVAQRHIARLLAQQSQVTPLAVGATILALLAAGNGIGDVTQAVLLGSQAALTQSGINFTRDMEREADRIGQRIFDEVGYPRGEFGAMFNKLYEASRLNDDGSFPYLRSHPLNHERLAEVLARTQGQEAAKSQEIVALAWGQWMRARAQVLQTSRSEDWHDWLESTPDSVATPSWQAYRAALSAQALGKRHQAWQRLEHLRQRSDLQDILRQVLVVDQLQLWLSPGEVLAPEQTVQAWVQEGLGSRYRAVWLIAAQSASRWPKMRAVAVSKLQSWLVMHAVDAKAWEVLASLREAQGQTLRALRAQAEAQAARGEWDGALDRLRAAQDWSREHPSEDPVEAQVVWARERAMREAMRTRLAAERTVQ